MRALRDLRVGLALLAGVAVALVQSSYAATNESSLSNTTLAAIIMLLGGDEGVDDTTTDPNDFDGDGVADEDDPAPLDPLIFDEDTYNVADFDGDGIINLYDADDDGDGVIDRLDVDPTNVLVNERLSSSPWINNLLLTAPEWADGRNELIVE